MKFKSEYILQFIFLGGGVWWLRRFFIISLNLIAREIFCLYIISPFSDFYDSFHTTRCLILCRYERYRTQRCPCWLKPPLSNGLSNIDLTTMSFMFFGRLITVIEGSLKRPVILSLVYKMGKQFLRMRLRTVKAGVIGSKTRNPAFCIAKEFSIFW